MGKRGVLDLLIPPPLSLHSLDGSAWMGSMELMALSQKGWILAPSEERNNLLERQKAYLEAPIPLEKIEEEVSSLLRSLYDVSLQEALVIRGRKELLPWQGAVLWEYREEKTGEKFPVIQLPQKEKNPPPFFHQKEAFAHELVHAVRFSFKEPLFEEIFAYRTSSSSFRRFLGPLFLFPLEASLLAGTSFLAPILSVFGLDLWAFTIPFSLFSFFFLRLLSLQALFFLAWRKAKQMNVSHPLAVLFRLSDQEMIKMALSSSRKIVQEWKEKKAKEDRFSVIASYLD